MERLGSSFISQNCDACSFLLQLLSAAQPTRTAVNSSMKTSLWTLSIEFRQLFSMLCGRTDLFPALTSSYRREGRKTVSLQTNAANPRSGRALFEFSQLVRTCSRCPRGTSPRSMNKMVGEPPRMLVSQCFVVSRLLAICFARLEHDFPSESFLRESLGF